MAPSREAGVACCTLLRTQVKIVAEEVAKARTHPSIGGEAVANVVLAYRHLEDANMRLGKAIQALDGGVSVYDKSTAVTS